MDKFNKSPITGEAWQERSTEQKRADFQNITEHNNQPLPTDAEQVRLGVRGLLRLVSEGHFAAIKYLLDNKGQEWGYRPLGSETLVINPNKDRILEILNHKLDSKK